MIVIIDIQNILLCICRVRNN